ncbi:MAG: 3-isopropylmalate dehydrogenase [Melioribacteraceae bacterium]|nr:3-isopropylmalate dehydrogenase [Melioribacteraceae bacterium]MCF8265753.1 3-isopropylmalate dehydrogenase [Melioribacteraceae bacterium]MCF8413191.1 3-isopropylmalate dehydrogenase [Melioribacteraceae bacterium]
MNYRVTLLPGDGIGPEVTKAAVDVMKFIANKFDVDIQTTEELMGGCSYEKHGTPLTDETLQACYDSDAVFLGAVGGYKWDSLPHRLKPEAALLKLRKSLGLFANIRPAKVYSAFVNSSSLKSEIINNTDFIVFRELTGGIYFGEPRGMDENKGWNTMVYSREEVIRIARMAFLTARRRNKVVTNVDKANVLEVSQFWRNVVEEVSKDYPDVELRHMYVDNAAMQIVRNPKQFDVIVTGNIFGDIISDIAGMITGSLGMLPSASLGKDYALYEPVHGSAPDIAGKNIANPIAAITSVAMMFEHTFEMDKAAELIYSAVSKTLGNGYRTADIGKETDKIVSTDEMTKLIKDEIENIYNEQAIGVFTL